MNDHDKDHVSLLCPHVSRRDYVHRVGRTARAGRSGWSLSFVTQHDVQLVHKIEELIGHQLGEFKAEEAEVLKGITKVGRKLKDGGLLGWASQLKTLGMQS